MPSGIVIRIDRFYFSRESIEIWAHSGIMPKTDKKKKKKIARAPSSANGCKTYFRYDHVGVSTKHNIALIQGSLTSWGTAAETSCQVVRRICHAHHPCHGRVRG
jgi:hypothetical protein